MRPNSIIKPASGSRSVFNRGRPQALRLQWAGKDSTREDTDGKRRSANEPASGCRKNRAANEGLRIIALPDSACHGNVAGRLLSCLLPHLCAAEQRVFAESQLSRARYAGRTDVRNSGEPGIDTGKLSRNRRRQPIRRDFDQGLPYLQANWGRPVHNRRLWRSADKEPWTNNQGHLLLRAPA